MPATIKQINTPSLELDHDEELTCAHTDYHWETTEVDTMRNGEHDTYEVETAVCDSCGADLPETERGTRI